MQGIPLLALTFAVLYLGHKLLSFVKALKAIQYTYNLIFCNSFHLVRYPQVPPWETCFLIIIPSKCHSTQNMGDYSWAELFIHRKT